MKTFVDLVLDSSDLVRIEAPATVEDALHDSLQNSMKQRSTWSPGQFDECTATLNGLHLSRVNMAKVVGML